MIIQGVTLDGTRVVDGGVMPTNLILYLDADNSSSYSGSGTTLNDLSGNGYTHTLSNSNLYTELGGVKCFNCSSVGQVITAVSGTIQIPTNFTYISWVRVRASTAGYRTLLRCNGTGGHAIIVNTGTNTLGMWDNLPGNTGFNSSGYDMSAYGDVWAQFATVGDASGQTFYINGQQVGSSVAKSVAGLYHLAWGNIQSANDQPWGYVANLELYNIKLTPEQLQQNYYGLRSRFSVQTFTTTGTTSWIAPSDVTSVEYLVVAGGGGAGNGYDNAGGGGGGAGMVRTGTLSVTPGQSYTVTVGAGGAGGADTRTNNPGSPGSNSVFATITALGGGQGLGSRTGGAVGAAQIGNTTAATGGSGTGGGLGGKGGGGATGAGSANSGATGGAGGSGVSNSITDSAVTYGVGGAGGGAGAPTTDGANGTANRGNGGQGGKSNSADSAKGGDGGSGIVVLKYGY
jgi:hypothetical protein